MGFHLQALLRINNDILNKITRIVHNRLILSFENRAKGRERTPNKNYEFYKYLSNTKRYLALTRFKP